MALTDSLTAEDRGLVFSVTWQAAGSTQVTYQLSIVRSETGE